MCTVCPRQRGEHEETHSTSLVREQWVWTQQDLRANEPFKSRCLEVAERAESSESEVTEDPQGAEGEECGSQMCLGGSGGSK